MDRSARKAAKENSDYQKVMALDEKTHGGKGSGGGSGDAGPGDDGLGADGKKMTRKERRAATRVS